LLYHKVPTDPENGLFDVGVKDIAKGSNIPGNSIRPIGPVDPVILLKPVAPSGKKENNVLAEISPLSSM
jgi:hypothetical protein